MYKLTIISGPSADDAGKTFELQEGPNSVGRQSTNVIQLKSHRISKQHCYLTVNGEDVIVEDVGSANGTFVNGVLSHTKHLQEGDRLGVGEFVLELVRVEQPINFDYPVHPVQKAHSHLQLVTTGEIERPSPTEAPASAAQTLPQDWKERVIWVFEKAIMPFFYNLNLKYELRWILGAIGLSFILISLLISVYPLVESNRESVIYEASQRVRFVAKQLAEQNAPTLAVGQESRTFIGPAQDDPGIRMALVADLNSRIIAPADRMNQYLGAGKEATLAVKVSQMFKDGRETGVLGKGEDGILIAIEPIKAFDATLGRNRVIAMALASVDVGLSLPSFSTILVVYFNALVMTLIAAALLFVIAYRLVVKRVEVLNEDIDLVLRGESQKITRDFQWGEMNNLLDIVSAALQRIPRSGTDDGLADPFVLNAAVDSFFEAIKLLGVHSKQGILILDQDKRIVFINNPFEEISGIRSEVAVGSDIPSVSRDEAFGAWCSDILKQIESNPNSQISEKFDFSGQAYRATATKLGTDKIGGFLFLFEKDEV